MEWSETGEWQRWGQDVGNVLVNVAAEVVRGKRSAEMKSRELDCGDQRWNSLPDSTKEINSPTSLHPQLDVTFQNFFP